MSQTKVQLVNNVSGNSGFGTASPANKIHLNESTSGSNYVHFTNSSTGTSASDGAQVGIDGNESLILWQAESNTIRFATDNTERMLIDSSGNVGIGTSSPSSFNSDGRNLVVGTGSGGQGLSIYSANNNYGNIYFADGTSAGSYNAGGILYNHSSNFMRFDTAAAERMRIDSSGRVFVGTTSTDPHNDGSGILIHPTAGILIGVSNTHAGIFARHSGQGELLRFQSGNTDVGSIDTSGSGVNYTSGSDYRLKENIVALTDGITRLKTLKPSRFNFISDPDKTVDGFIAHEVTAVPEAVTGTKDEVDSDNNPVYQGIDLGKLVPLLTAALQEEIAKREALETRVEALEAT